MPQAANQTKQRKREQLAVQLADSGILAGAAETVLCRLFEDWFKSDTVEQRERIFAQAEALEAIRIEVANALSDEPAVVSTLIGYNIKIARRWPWQKKQPKA